MPLTPADVHNVAFKKPSIGKRGYDEDEVDAFLDVVEAELSRLIEENSELTARLTEFEAGGTPAPRVEAARAAVAAEAAAAAGAGRRPATATPRRPGCCCSPRRRPTGSPRRPRPNPTSCWRMRRVSPTRWSATPPPAPRPPNGTAGSRPRRSTPRPRPGTTRCSASSPRTGRSGEEDRGPAQLRAGVPRPAEELDQRPAGAARRRRQQERAGPRQCVRRPAAASNRRGRPVARIGAGRNRSRRALPLAR